MCSDKQKTSPRRHRRHRDKDFFLGFSPCLRASVVKFHSHSEHLRKLKYVVREDPLMIIFAFAHAEVTGWRGSLKGRTRDSGIVLFTRL